MPLLSFPLLRWSLLFVWAALALAGCTGFSDASELQAEEEPCTIDLDTTCPAGTQKQAFSNAASVGVCDAGEGSRYLRDINQATAGFCNGTSNDCGYICVKDTNVVVCEGKGSCSPGFNLVSQGDLEDELIRVTEGKTPVSDMECKDGKILDDAGTPIASCETEGTCEYFCVREFSFDCQCAADEFGNCLPCDGCTYETDLICSDGSCISVALVAEGLCAEPGGPPCGPELQATLQCIWYSSAPPPTCTPEALDSYQPPEEALEGCVPQEHLFICTDGTVLPDVLLCNGTEECTDGADEDSSNCNTPLPIDCTDGTIPCKQDNQAICITTDQVCDGIEDCGSGLVSPDEAFCDGVCGPGQISCGNGFCVDVQTACNGTEDCDGGRDEAQGVCTFFRDGGL